MRFYLLFISLHRLDFGPLTIILTIERTYSLVTLESDVEGTIVLLPINVITPVEYTLGRYSVHVHIMSFLNVVF